MGHADQEDHHKERAVDDIAEQRYKGSNLGQRTDEGEVAHHQYDRAEQPHDPFERFVSGTHIGDHFGGGTVAFGDIIDFFALRRDVAHKAVLRHGGNQAQLLPVVVLPRQADVADFRFVQIRGVGQPFAAEGEAIRYFEVFSVGRKCAVGGDLLDLGAAEGIFAQRHLVGVPRLTVIR